MRGHIVLSTARGPRGRAAAAHSARGRTRISFALTAIALLVAALGGHAEASFQPYERAASAVLAPGVEHLRLTGGSQAINVAHIGPKAKMALRTVLSHDRIEGEPERTSSMCARVNCLVAVNGDFSLDGVPVGGLMSGGRLLRSPGEAHHQLLIGRGGTLRAGGLSWNGRLLASDLREIDLTDVNVPRGKNDLVLYTPSFGPTTGTNRHGVELVVKVLKPAGPIRAGSTAVVRILGADWDGDAKIPAGGAVLSAHGSSARALARLWEHRKRGVVGSDLLVRIETSARESIGGTPILVRDGARWFADAATPFVRGRHPRTIVGWNDAGDRWLVTVDGRQGSDGAGMTLAEAADLMISLGATDAINLDGGGSTTFVVDGIVANRPSDRLIKEDGEPAIVAQPRRGQEVLGNVERPVVTALALVPLSEKGVRRAADGIATLDVKASETMTIPVASSATDPASNPLAAWPEATGPAGTATDGGKGTLTWLAVALNIAVASAWRRRLYRHFGLATRGEGRR